MGQNSEAVKKWRASTKDRIVKSFNGSCGICGYSKCLDALDLHHLDPSTKEISIGKIRANPISWDKIVIELRKCILICANCHREVHAGIKHDLNKCPRFNEEFIQYKPIASNLKCPVCDADKADYRVTCSKQCAAKFAGSVDWSKFDLHNLYIEQRLTQSQISEMVGCTDASVLKRLRKLKLK